MPVGRVLVGTVGTAAGATGTAICGTSQGILPTIITAGDIALVGTAYPAGRLLWHQPAWALSIFSAEPLPEHDGRWTLRIISQPIEPRPASPACGPVPPAAPRPEPAPAKPMSQAPTA